MVMIEVISYLSRIISLSVRLFANMMAGHVMLKVFGSFIVMLGGLGLIGYPAAGLSLAVNTLLIGFELLVACLQAYVFAGPDVHLPARRGPPALNTNSHSIARATNHARRKRITKGYRTMDVASAKMLGAGISMIALAGVGIGMGTIFGQLVSSVARNPARARPRVRPGDPGLRVDRGRGAVRPGHRVHHSVRLIGGGCASCVPVAAPC